VKGKSKLRRRAIFMLLTTSCRCALWRAEHPNRIATSSHIAPEELQAGMRLVISQSGSINEDALLARRHGSSFWQARRQHP